MHLLRLVRGLPVLLPQKRLNKLFQMPTLRYTGRKKVGEIDGLYKHWGLDRLRLSSLNKG